MPHPALAYFRVVLIEPQDNKNIGSVARAMKNLGFDDLHLVNPLQFDKAQATITGRWAADILEKATIHTSTSTALAECEDVVGFSSRYPEHRIQLGILPEWAASLDRNKLKKTALVFGREDHGLTDRDLENCRQVMRIPSTADYPSMNLAQAVMLGLYEVSRITFPDIIERPNPVPAPWNAYEQLDRKFEAILTDIGFFKEGTPEPIPSLLKNLVRRMQTDDREMKVLLGMFSRIQKSLERRRRGEPD